jgi:hypothetical protein
MRSHFRSHFRTISHAILIVLLLSGCSYRWGFRERSVPGGYKEVAIPIFKNTSTEAGVETAFTNALILQFERSQVARVTSAAAAPVRIEGEITKITLTGTGGGLIGGKDPNNPLPANAALWTEYQIDVQAKITVRRQSDEKILWQSAFNEQKNYDAPRIGEPVVNSANATYNDSARRHALEALADDMMAEAHDRITENF